MEAASERLDFEEAARLRDQVAMIRTLQARQYVEGQVADMDLLACAMQGTHACVLLLAFRDGRNLGTRAFFPKTNGSDSPAEVLARSEEHTSELQSLMRISYAVFCLKKKKHHVKTKLFTMHHQLVYYD